MNLPTRVQHEIGLCHAHLAKVCGQLNQAFQALREIEQAFASEDLDRIGQVLKHWKDRADFSWNTTDDD